MVTIATAVDTAAREAGRQAYIQTAADYVVDQLDLGSGAASPKLQLGDGTFATIYLEVDLNSTNAFDNATTGGVASLNGVLQGTAGASGIPTNYRYIDKDGTVIMSGTSISEPGGGGEIQITDADTGTAGIQVQAGLVYNVTSGTYTRALVLS